MLPRVHPSPTVSPTLAGLPHRPCRGWQQPRVPWPLGSAAWHSQAPCEARGRGRVLEGAGSEHGGGGLAYHLPPHRPWVPNWARVGASGRPGPPPHPSRTRHSLRGRPEPSGATGEGASRRESGYFSWWLRGRDELPASSLYVLNLAAGGKQSRRPLVKRPLGLDRGARVHVLPLRLQHKQTHLVPRANKTVPTRPQCQQPGAGATCGAAGSSKRIRRLSPGSGDRRGHSAIELAHSPHGVETEARRGEGPPREGHPVHLLSGAGCCPPSPRNSRPPGPSEHDPCKRDPVEAIKLKISS